jgi:hypothetical protein
MQSNWHILCELCRLAAEHAQHIPIAVHTVPPDDEQNSARNMIGY